MTNIPKFAVVGHPNKGKSSLVASLARDEFVPIGANPGTTSRATVYPLSVSGRVLYELIDTPGFQQPRAVLQWLESHDTGLAARPHVVKTFLSISAHRERFPEEFEILSPIVEGAAVIYVVDGSIPYSEEYETELEILRWCSGARIGLVNPIGGSEFVEDWKVALRQYCGVVRVFDPLAADFDKCIELLEVCATVSETWGATLLEAIEVLKNDRQLAQKRSQAAICDLLTRSLSLVLEEPINSSLKQSEQLEELRGRFEEKLISFEKQARLEVERAFNYKQLSRSETSLDVLEDAELLSQESWRLFGLSRTALAKSCAIAGAVAGSALDAVVGGASLMLGAAAGGVIGAGSSLLFGEQLVDRSFGFLSFGKRLVTVGPVQTPQFIFILLNRARLHYSLVSRRSHANRSELSLPRLYEERLAPLSDAQREFLVKVATAFRKQKVSDSQFEELRELIKQLVS